MIQAPQFKSNIKVNQIDYKIKGNIGKGGEGNVFLACDGQNNYFAVKIIETITMAAKDNVINEINIQSEFYNDPYIIKCLGVNFTSYSTEIFLEIGSCSLRNVIEHRGIRVRQFFKIACDLCKGLLSIHKKNYIHRDIKPQNIILVQNKYKITDFGVSVQQDKNENYLVGTAPYMAPELLFNEKKEKEKITNKIDIWSMGVTLFSIIFKVNPFFPKDIQSFFAEIKKNIVKLTSDDGFTMQKFLQLLQDYGLNKEKQYVSNKMRILNKDVLTLFSITFKRKPEQREDISFFLTYFQSLQDSLPPSKVNLRIKYEDLPIELKMFTNTLNMMYELDTQLKGNKTEQGIFSVQFLFWYVSGKNYGRKPIFEPQNIQITLQEPWPHHDVEIAVQRGIKPYFEWLKQNNVELAFYQNIVKLRLSLLLVCYWLRIFANLSKFNQVVFSQIPFQINNPLELLELLPIYTSKNIDNLQRKILQQYSFN